MFERESVERFSVRLWPVRTKPQAVQEPFGTSSRRRTVVLSSGGDDRETVPTTFTVAKSIRYFEEER